MPMAQAATARPAYITVDPALINVPVAGRYIVSDAPTAAAAIAGQFDPYPPLASSAGGSVVFSTSGYTIGRGYLAADIPQVQGTVTAARLRFSGCRFGTLALPAGTVVLNPGNLDGRSAGHGWPEGRLLGRLLGRPDGRRRHRPARCRAAPAASRTAKSSCRSIRPTSVPARFCASFCGTARIRTDLTASYPAAADPQGRWPEPGTRAPGHAKRLGRTHRALTPRISDWGPGLSPGPLYGPKRCPT